MTTGITRFAAGSAPYSLLWNPKHSIRKTFRPSRDCHQVSGLNQSSSRLPLGWRGTRRLGLRGSSSDRPLFLWPESDFEAREQIVDHGEVVVLGRLPHQCERLGERPGVQAGNLMHGESLALKQCHRAPCADRINTRAALDSWTVLGPMPRAPFPL